LVRDGASPPDGVAPTQHSASFAGIKGRARIQPDADGTDRGRSLERKIAPPNLPLRPPILIFPRQPLPQQLHVAAIRAPHDIEGVTDEWDRADKSIEGDIGEHADKDMRRCAELSFLSTFPIVIPFILIGDARLALRLSNAVAIAMLFVCGYAFGRCAGFRPWAAGLSMVAIGASLVGVAIALGG
jgi:hypothetical protein